MSQHSSASSATVVAAGMQHGRQNLTGTDSFAQENLHPFQIVIDVDILSPCDLPILRQH